ncbi:YjbQ family protein [SAR202 cluster bacterium AD-802-E10_MRT_200m]|nr:YjbQ family protein [SAR202 cluster bacterium AD-802-E10_MRT_200m]
MKVFSITLTVESSKAPEFIDISEEVFAAVKDSGVRMGFVIVFSRHTTAAIKINELEPLLLKDMEDFLERLSPKDGSYRHNDFSIRTVNMNEDECPNGHAHCQHLALTSSETIPIVDGQVSLGNWQRIFMIELDRPRSREVLFQVIGV